MAKVTVETPKGFQRLEPIVREEFIRALRQAADGMYAALHLKFKEEDIDEDGATGATWKSVKIGNLKMMGDRAAIEIAPTGDRARIMNFIEYGRKRGAAPPPLEPIMEWLRARKIVSDADDPRMVRAIAYTVSKNISERGIAPKHIFSTTSRVYKRQVIKFFEDATRRVVQRMNGDTNIGQRRTG